MRPSLALLGLSPAALHAETFSADVRAGNWFEMRIDGTEVAEDSVPIPAERSFNAESFAFEATRPFVIGLVAKDFKENGSGPEYIGTPRQQMGDGGVILQIRDAAGATVAVSDTGWQCRIIHTAPLDEAREDATDPVAGGHPCRSPSEPEDRLRTRSLGLRRPSRSRAGLRAEWHGPLTSNRLITPP